MYSPDLGRFISEDPIDYEGGDSNLYRFAGNDPVNFADPSGLSQAGHPLKGFSTLAGPQVGTTSVLAGLGLGAAGLNLNIQPQARTNVEVVSAGRLIPQTNGIGLSPAPSSRSGLTSWAAARGSAASAIGTPRIDGTPVGLNEFDARMQRGEQYRQAIEQQVRDSQTVVYVEVYGDGKAPGVLGYLLPNVQPLKRAFYKDGHSKFFLGGDIADTASAFTIPGAGGALKAASKAQLAERAAEAVTSAARRATQAADGFFDDLARVIEFDRPALASSSAGGGRLPNAGASARSTAKTAGGAAGRE
jgi:hypothetical protein